MPHPAVVLQRETAHVSMMWRIRSCLARIFHVVRWLSSFSAFVIRLRCAVVACKTSWCTEGQPSIVNRCILIGFASSCSAKSYICPGGKFSGKLAQRALLSEFFSSFFLFASSCVAVVSNMNNFHFGTILELLSLVCSRHSAFIVCAESKQDLISYFPMVNNVVMSVALLNAHFRVGFYTSLLSSDIFETCTF